jgi:hypothetical protein
MGLLFITSLIISKYIKVRKKLIIFILIRYGTKALSIITLSITPLNITPLSKKDLYVTLSMSNCQHKQHSA